MHMDIWQSQVRDQNGLGKVCDALATTTTTYSVMGSWKLEKLGNPRKLGKFWSLQVALERDSMDNINCTTWKGKRQADLTCSSCNKVKPFDQQLCLNVLCLVVKLKLSKCQTVGLVISYNLKTNSFTFGTLKSSIFGILDSLMFRTLKFFTLDTSKAVAKYIKAGAKDILTLTNPQGYLHQCLEFGVCRFFLSEDWNGKTWVLMTRQI